MTSGPALSSVAPLTAKEFAWITTFLRKHTGIELKEGKQTLVMGRLDRRLRLHDLVTYTEYFQLIAGAEAPGETQMAIDLLTTNETYFFREPAHFERFPTMLPGQREIGGRPIRVWSAASSSGEEAYTVALTLAECIPDRPWEIVGSDISTRVLETARRCLYPIDAAERIPEKARRAHCLKGRGELDGLFTLRAPLRDRVSFVQANLMKPLPDLGLFDVVLLRNVMIYFSQETKAELLDRIDGLLRPGGYLLIGHAESLHGLNTRLKLIVPSVYHKPPA
ncbi:MAG TPA: protein-glutamate O-methyltransferase CheR [Kineosporiaceae bacterium]|nr:protein-glutamate O-methyltransferase CheR [Kineosporiaceae bacterium]